MRALAVSACLLIGGCSSREKAAAPLVQHALHHVSISGMKFVPERLSIAAGDEVEWKNEDIVPHTAAAPGVFSSPVMAPGEVFRATVGSSGAVPYGCTLHPTMRASLTVTP